MKLLCALTFLMTSLFAASCPDSTLVLYHADGNHAAQIEYCGEKVHGQYTRWYPNGKKHWEIQFEDGRKNGEARIYNLRGKCVLQLQYAADSLVKVESQSKKEKVILGTLRYSSVVHGGVMREDGLSNIQRSEGILKNHAMYLANWHPDKKTTKAFRFSSDLFGWYAVCVPVGDYGLFVGDQPIEEIEPGVFGPPQKSTKSWHQGWNITEPIQVAESDTFIEKNWKRSFVGYAP